MEKSFLCLKRIFQLMVITLSIGQAAAQGNIEVSVINLKTNKGVCRLCLFNSAEAYHSKKQKPVKCLSLPVRNQKATGVFENIAAGSYAIFVFHDANNNNYMDKNFIGVPTEGYGASLNKLPFASAPTFEENKFTLRDKSTREIIIRLRNLF